MHRLAKPVLLLVILFTLPFSYLCAQKKDLQIFFGAGPAFNGSGDGVGLKVFQEIQIPLSQRFFVNPGFQFTRDTWQEINRYGEIRNISTGISLHTNINYAFLQKNRHRIAVGVGPYIRHQIATDGYLSFHLDQQNDPVVELIHYEPFKILSAGYNVDLSYYCWLSKRISAGARLAIQNDTNADMISSANLMFGIHL